MYEGGRTLHTERPGILYMADETVRSRASRIVPLAASTITTQTMGHASNHHLVPSVSVCARSKSTPNTRAAAVGETTQIITSPGAGRS